MIFITLFFEFLKIGLFSVGGGLATLPFLHHMIEQYGWITQEDLLNMIAVAESTPGPIGINTATFTGFRVAGLLGGIIASLALVLPSLVIIMLIAHYFKEFSEKPYIQSAFLGVRPAVVGLIGAAAYSVVKVSLIDLDAFKATGELMNLLDFKAIALFALMFFLIQKYKKHPILYIVAAGVIGVVFKF